MTAAAIEGPEGNAAHVVQSYPYIPTLPALDAGMREMIAARAQLGQGQG
jgi:hypothetical protein